MVWALEAERNWRSNSRPARDRDRAQARTAKAARLAKGARTRAAATTAERALAARTAKDVETARDAAALERRTAAAEDESRRHRAGRAAAEAERDVLKGANAALSAKVAALEASAKANERADAGARRRRRALSISAKETTLDFCGVGARASSSLRRVSSQAPKPPRATGAAPRTRTKPTRRRSSGSATRRGAVPASLGVFLGIARRLVSPRTIHVPRRRRD